MPSDTEIREYRLSAADGPVLVEARLLAHQSNRRVEHTCDRAGHRPPCRACRWLELTLYRERGGGYVLHVVGRTTRAGEVDLPRVERTTSPFEVVELLTQHPKDQPARLPRPSALLLARAADVDDGIHGAYVNRAVA